MNLHLEWKDELVAALQTVAKGLSGLPTSSKLGATVSVLDTHLQRLYRHLRHVRSVEWAVKYYLLETPGGVHDRLDQEIAQVAEDFVSRRYTGVLASTAAREKILRYISVYKQSRPLPREEGIEKLQLQAPSGEDLNY